MVAPFGSVDAMAAKAADVIVIVTTVHYGRDARNRQLAKIVLQNDGPKRGGRRLRRELRPGPDCAPASGPFSFSNALSKKAPRVVGGNRRGAKSRARRGHKPNRDCTERAAGVAVVAMRNYVEAARLTSAPWRPIRAAWTRNEPRPARGRRRPSARPRRGFCCVGE
jgi:hypothetical protein